MTIREALNKGTIMLKSNNIESPRLKSRLLLQYVLNKPREYLIIYDKKEIGKKEQWEYFKENQISVQVLDMPSLNLDYTDEKMQPITQLINNIIFEIFSWKAESDRIQIVERTKQGLEQAKSRGKTLGRPKVEITDEFIEVWKKWKNGEIKTTVQAMKESHTAKTTFYRFNKILEQQEVHK